MNIETAMDKARDLIAAEPSLLKDFKTIHIGTDLLPELFNGHHPAVKINKNIDPMTVEFRGNDDQIIALISFNKKTNGFHVAAMKMKWMLR